MLTSTSADGHISDRISDDATGGCVLGASPVQLTHFFPWRTQPENVIRTRLFDQLIIRSKSDYITDGAANRDSVEY